MPDTGLDDDPFLHSVWADNPDETDEPLRVFGPVSRRHTDSVPLTALCAAQDALARLDARAAAAPATLRSGLIARMAFTEAAGWLAHARSWVHPLDLALHDLTLIGSGARVLPHTSAAGRGAWDDLNIDTFAAGDRAIAEACALARLLRRLASPGAHDLFTDAATAAATLAPFDAGSLDAERFVAWRAAFSSRSVRNVHTSTASVHTPRGFVHTPGNFGHTIPPALPPLLRAAEAAAEWMTAGIADVPTPLQAVLAAVALLARIGPARCVFVPVWAAYPANATGDRTALPRLRRLTAQRFAAGEEAGWMPSFLCLVAESARTGLRELDRLETVGRTAAALTTRADRRSRLPNAIEAALRSPLLTAKALAAQLRITPQTATALLRALCTEGLVREVTGRRSFQAFAA